MSDDVLEEIATRGSWTTLPLGLMQAIPYRATFSQPEFAVLRRGLIPVEMEDKWFVFCEGNSLFFHRSWTGHCVYRAEFTNHGDRVQVTGAEVSADGEYYRRGPDSHETAQLRSLIR